MARFPYSNRPDDIIKLLEKIPAVEVPAGNIQADYIKSLGFPTASSKYLWNILKMLGFIGDNDEATTIWQAYATKQERGLVLAAAIKRVYAGLFELSLCPYLEDDPSIAAFFKREEEKITARDVSLMISIFRNLSEISDFQDLMDADEEKAETSQAIVQENIEVKVKPDLQVTIQVHIDPATPDEKIETIFKNMRKYLLERPAK